MTNCLFNDFGSNRFRKSGKCCPPWTMNHKIGDSSNIATRYTSAADIKNLGVRYYATYCSPVGRWFSARNWCVLMGMVMQVYLMYDCCYAFDRIVQK